MEKNRHEVMKRLQGDESQTTWGLSIHFWRGAGCIALRWGFLSFLFPRGLVKRQVGKILGLTRRFKQITVSNKKLLLMSSLVMSPLVMPWYKGAEQPKTTNDVEYISSLDIERKEPPFIQTDLQCQ